MSEHHEHTEFLKHCLRYDDSPERHAITEKLTRLQSELRSVKRASGLMGFLIMLAVTSFAYLGGLVPVFPYNMQRFVMNMLLGLFAGSSVCLFAFVVLGIFLFRKLHRQREAGRQLLIRLFAARLAVVRQ